MILKNIKANKKVRGFTIVELLVVIVVIGILAAITIVSYTGITSRANGAKAVANAQQIQAVAEAINADNGSFPTITAQFTSMTSSAKIPAGITIQVAAPTALNGTTNFQLFTLTTLPATGGKIVYWDYSTGAVSTAAASYYWGAATSASAVTVFAS